MKKQQRRLKLIKDSDYAFTEGTTIHVNIQRLWKEAYNFPQFVNLFSQTHTHEMLHLLMTHLKPKTLLGEEKAIRKVLNEPWDAELEQIYEKMYAA